MNIISQNIIIKDDIEFYKLLNTFEQNKKYLLNNKKEFFSLVEKLLYELALYHAKCLDLNEEDIFIEFCVKTELSNNFDIEYDKHYMPGENLLDIVTPVITTITYLNNNKIPDIITNIDMDSYKFKEFHSGNNTIKFIFPKLLKHISFDGGKFYHGIQNILNETNERLILKMNIWITKPLNIPFFVDNSEQTISKNIKIIDKIEELDNNIIIEDDHIDNYFFENMLYKHNLKLNNKIYEIIKQKSDILDFLITSKNDKNDKNYKNDKILIDISKTKFIQRFLFKKFYENFICNYILNQSILIFNKNNENNENNENIIEIDKIPNIMSLILTSFQIIIENIKKSYGIRNNVSYNIEKLFIINRSSLINEQLHDSSLITVNILLSSKFDGGHLQFDDELEYFLEQGDMIIFNSNHKPLYQPIISGNQYILVGLINIYKQD